MKAYKVEVLVIDHDGIGAEDIRYHLEETRYPNRCMGPKVMQVTEVDIGEWHDEHPLNLFAEWKDEYERLFPPHRGIA